MAEVALRIALAEGWLPFSSKGAALFTLAHEVGHALIHRMQGSW